VASRHFLGIPGSSCNPFLFVVFLNIGEFIQYSDKARAEQRETDGSATITPEEDRYAPFKVDANYVHKHKPEAGGYYVVYADGYKSFSPAKAFEDGYSLV
jgi:hypothetical protein